MKKLILSLAVIALSVAACSKADISVEPTNAQTSISVQNADNKDDYFKPDKLDTLNHPEYLNMAFLGTLEATPSEYATETGAFPMIDLYQCPPLYFISSPYKKGAKVKISLYQLAYNPELLHKPYKYTVLQWNIIRKYYDGTPESGSDNVHAGEESFSYTVGALDHLVIFQPVLKKVAKPKFQTNIVSATPAMGSVTGSGQYYVGEYFTIKATPAAGCEFDRWEITGTQSGWEVPAYKPTIESPNAAETRAFLNKESINYTIKAHFKYKNGAMVSVQSAGNGTVSGGGVKPLNTPFTITATPAAGYEFNYWSKNGAWVSDKASYTTSITTQDPVTFVANFKQAVAKATFNINCMFGDGLSNASKIEYCDSDGTWKTENLTSGSLSYSVKGGTNVRVYVEMSALWADRIYCMYKNPDGSIRDLSSSDPFFVEYFDYQDVSGTYNVTLRAETSDFREEFR